jgi:hypothetical protein
MAESTKANGLTTIWKVWVSILGKTDGNTKGSIKMTKSMVSDFTPGLTRGNIKVCGTVVSNMD